MTGRTPHPADPMPLYPSEDRIACAILGPERAKDWPAIAAHDTKHGLPPIDPVRGGRYWPAVERFYNVINGLDRAQAEAGPSGGQRRVLIRDMAPDGKEDFRGEKDAALRHRRPSRRAVRARA